MNISDRFSHGQHAPLLANVFERLAADILHDDEAFGAVIDKVIDADNVGVFDHREKLAFGNGNGGASSIFAVEQPFQNHVARQGFVKAQINPA